MNTNTGAIRAMAELTDEERESGKWVPVSDELATAAQRAGLEERVLRLQREVTEADRRQLEGLRKPGRR